MRRILAGAPGGCRRTGASASRGYHRPIAVTRTARAARPIRKETTIQTDPPESSFPLTLRDVHAAVVVFDVTGFDRAAAQPTDAIGVAQWLERSTDVVVVETNDRALALWGVADPAALRAHFQPGSDALELCVPALCAWARGERTCQSDGGACAAQGDLLHVRCQASLLERDGRVLCVTTFTDITDHLRLHEQLERERSGRLLANLAARLGIWEQDLRSDEVVFDEGYHELLGLPNGTLNGPVSMYRDRIHPDDLPTSLAYRERAINGEFRVLESRLRLRCGDGSYRHFLSRGEVTEADEHGRPLRAVGILQNVEAEVTSEKLLRLEGAVLGDLAAEQDLSESLHRLCLGVESVWDQARCAINLYEPETETLHFGAAPSLPAVYRDVVEGLVITSQPSVCGLSLETGTFAHIADFTQAPALFEATLPFYESLGVRSCWSMPVRVGDRYLATCCVLRALPGSPSKVEVMQIERLARTVGLLIEAHRQRRNRVLLENQVRTKDRLESLGKLAGGIAHDFNNLLTVIMSHAELLELQADHPETRESAEQIQRTSGVAADLCRQMLTYAGETPFQLRPLELDAVVDEIVRIVRSGSPQRVRFETLGHGTAGTILGDPTMISQLVLNLVTNAVEAIDDHGVVRITSGQETLDRSAISSLSIAEEMRPGVYAFVRVEDDGCGIDAGIRQRIFDPFFSTKPEGRGLGLATVFGTVRRHGGGLQLRSTHGSGAAFTVYFALHDEPVKEVRPAAPAVSDPRQRVVVVDDETTVRESLEKLLAHQGYQVTAFASGEAMLAELDAVRDCDVLLLDQRMPGLDGAETYRRLREREPELPVCFMSGYTTSAEISSFVHEDPCCSSIDKPFRTHELFKTMRTLARPDPAEPV